MHCFRYPAAARRVTRAGRRAALCGGLLVWLGVGAVGAATLGAPSAGAQPAGAQAAAPGPASAAVAGPATVATSAAPLAPAPAGSVGQARGAATPPAADATVGVGDRVIVKVWREPTFSDEFVVDERGTVVFPRLGAVAVAGWSVRALHDTLTARFAEYLRDPSLTVTVLRRVAVQGEVRAPNLYYVDATKTLREVLAEAGGITDAGNRKRVTIVRDGRAVRVATAADFSAPAADLRSGDQVLVPRRNWWARNSIAAFSTAGFALSALLSLVTTLRR